MSHCPAWQPHALLTFLRTDDACGLTSSLEKLFGGMPFILEPRDVPKLQGAAVAWSGRGENPYTQLIDAIRAQSGGKIVVEQGYRPDVDRTADAKGRSYA